MMSGTIGLASNCGFDARRHQTPSAMVMSSETAASKSTSRAISPRSAACLSMPISRAFTSASKPRKMRADLGVSPALGHELGTERHVHITALREVVLRHGFERHEEIGGDTGMGELLRHFGPVALGDPGDDRLLGAEVAIEIARAHAGLRADFLHGGLVEARARKADAGGVEDFGAAIGLQLGIGLAHGPGLRKISENERSFSLRRDIGRRGCCQIRRQSDGYLARRISHFRCQPAGPARRAAWMRPDPAEFKAGRALRPQPLGTAD